MSDTRLPDRYDRIALYVVVGIIAVGAMVTVVGAVLRLREIGDGRNVPVQVPLTGTTASLPLGPKGANVTATVDTATVTVPEPASAMLFALYALPVWVAVMVVAGLVVAGLFILRLARGRVFAPGTARLAYVAAGIVAAWWFGTTILVSMTTVGALSALSDDTYGAVGFDISLVPFLAIFLIAGVGSALQIGEKLQRDTEGLV